MRAGAFITHLLHAKPVGVSVGEHAGARATARGACREPARAGAEVLVVSWSWWSRLPCGGRLPLSSEKGACVVYFACMYFHSISWMLLGCIKYVSIGLEAQERCLSPILLKNEDGHRRGRLAPQDGGVYQVRSGPRRGAPFETL